MAVTEKLQEKLDLFKTCVRMEKPSRVPNVSNVFTWKVLDSGYPFGEVMASSELMEKVVFEFHERYQFDAYLDLGTRNQYKMLRILGGNTGYRIDEETGGVNYKEQTLMQADEYDEYLQDKQRLIWKMFRRKYPDLTKGQVLDAIRAMLEFSQYAGATIEKFIDTYDTPAVFDMFKVPMLPIESFFGNYRGIRELSLDMRKNKTKLKEAIDQDFVNKTFPKFKSDLANNNERFAFDSYTAILAHSVMSPKQFEEFYWPYLQQIIDAVVEADKTIYIFCESNIMRFCEFFQDIPKGHVVIHPELDDIFELRRRLPNICLAGGMKTQLLGNGTPAECVDYAKKLLDGMGDGFIFSQDKMISFKNDCRRENLLAVNEVVRNYRP